MVSSSENPGIWADVQRPTMSALENMEVKKGSHGPRYCKTCEHYKPPRGKSVSLVSATECVLMSSTSLSTMQDLCGESLALPAAMGLY